VNDCLLTQAVDAPSHAAGIGSIRPASTLAILSK
jgi:hypothetical protein